MKNDMSFKYVGEGVEDGSIDAANLIYGLRGLVKVSDVILDAYEPRRKKETSLQIKNFNKGSFETVLNFVEKIPVSMHDPSTIVVAVISALAWYVINIKKIELEISKLELEKSKHELEKSKHELEIIMAWYTINNKQIEKPENEEMRRVLSSILLKDSSMRKIKEGFRNMALPLNEDGISAVKFGLMKSPEEIMNKENKDRFLVKDIREEGMHEPITLIGSLRSLDKKTLNGRFVTNDKNTYSISLVMDSSEKYFNYFNKENITISGIAIYEKGSDEIIRIEIEQIC